MRGGLLAGAALAAGTALMIRLTSLGGPEPASGTPPGEARRAGVVDSLHAPEEQLRRFRATAPGPVTALADGAITRDALVSAWARAVAERDTARLRRLHLSRGEFAWLYYPSSEFSAPPYRQDPALLWFRLSAGSEKGLGRVLARHGGAGFRLEGYRCPGPPRVQGENRLWQDCVVRFREGDAVVERRLFGVIVERGGRYKFLGYGGDY